MIKKFLKNNKFLYLVYFYFFSFVFRFLGCLLRVNKKRILFMSFGGAKYDDSPKCIYELMKADPYFDSFELIWGFENVSNFPSVKNKVKANSIKFFWIALTSRIWITNSSIERGLRFKSNKIFSLNTWHGTPLKKMGTDSKINNGVKLLNNLSSDDGVLVQSFLDVKVFTNAMGASENNLLKFGLPRNDDLFSVSDAEIDNYRKKLGFGEDDKLILYAPTFRDFEKHGFDNVADNALDNVFGLLKNLPSNYKILYRAHYVIKEKNNITDNNRILDVTEFNNLNILIKISDMLVTDYSSIMFDYSITKKPIFIFSYDAENYKKNRGMYFDVEKELVYSHNSDGLTNDIINNSHRAKLKTVKFRNKYINYGGRSTENTVEYLKSIIKDQC